MTYEILELRRSRVDTGHGLVVVDYSQQPSLCRRGIWTGRQTLFTETVVLDFPHGSDLDNMTWIINGIIWPGHGGYTAATNDPLAGPVRGVPGIRYYTPVDGFYHRLALYSEPGAEAASIDLQVYYVADQSGYTPTVSVPVSGQSTTWPTAKVVEEVRCHQRFADIAQRYVRWAEPAILDPIALNRLPGRDGVRVRAMLEELEGLGEDDRELAEAITEELSTALRPYSTIRPVAGLS